jgi:hypothetical protein
MLVKDFWRMLIENPDRCLAIERDGGLDRVAFIDPNGDGGITVYRSVGEFLWTGALAAERIEKFSISTFNPMRPNEQVNLYLDGMEHEITGGKVCGDEYLILTVDETVQKYPGQI